jgi:signal transduction histidine kinase
MNDCVPPSRGGDDIMSYSQPLKSQPGSSAARRHSRAPTRPEPARTRQRSIPGDEPSAPNGRSPDSRALIVTLLWLGGFAIAEYVFSLPGLLPTAPHTELRLISFPMALFATALMLRPPEEAPAYAFLYALIGIGSAFHSPDFNFTVARIAIETAQTLICVGLLFRFFYHRFEDTLMVAAWAITVLLLCACGAAVMLLAAEVVPMSAADYAQELASSPALAWRYWWLGNACSYLTLAGPVAALVALRHRLKRVVVTPGQDRRRFIGLVVAVLVVSLCAFPVTDASWMGLPPDVALAKRLLPMPFAMVMAGRFRAYGAAVAILIFSLVAIASVTGPSAAANWPWPSAMITPTHALLLVTTTTCMVLAGISRQLKLALNEALEASQAQSRFIGMLNHELRTPLNAILGFSELIRLKSLSALGDALAPIENIHASGQRLLAMIEGLLEQAERGGGLFELSKQPVHVAQAVTAAAREIAQDVERFGCSLAIIADDELVIDADPRAFRQMLLVLLNFPLRFVGPDTVVTVSAEHVGTDTIIEVGSIGLINAAADDRDKIEVQLVKALALAHGARLTVLDSNRFGRIARLTFFATRAAA